MHRRVREARRRGPREIRCVKAKSQVLSRSELRDTTYIGEEPSTLDGRTIAAFTDAMPPTLSPPTSDSNVGDRENVRCNFCHADDFDILLSNGRDRRHHLPGEFRLVKCRECSLVYLNPRPDGRGTGRILSAGLRAVRTTRTFRKAHPLAPEQGSGRPAAFTPRRRRGAGGGVCDRRSPRAAARSGISRDRCGAQRARCNDSAHPAPSRRPHWHDSRVCRSREDRSTP